MKKKTVGHKPGILAIIPAAGLPSNSISGNQNLPDTMLPINGKPVIGYILDDLIKRKILNVIIVTHPADNFTSEYVNSIYGRRLHVKICKVKKHSHSIIQTVSTAVQQITIQQKGIFICLGDTIYKGPLSFKESFLVSDKKIENPSKWCMAERTEDSTWVFYDKPKDYKGDGSALCGIYFFSKSDLFLKSLNAVQNQTELSALLREYQNYEKISQIPAKHWYDCGNIENYHQARIDFLKVRFFNGIKFDPVRGVITKQSGNTQKMLQEINWYKKLPADLQIFTPRLIGFMKEKDYISYSLEFYGYPSLADLFTFGNEDFHFWKLTIEKILKIKKIFGTHNKKLPFKVYDAIYNKKTLERLAMLQTKTDWQELLSQEFIVINGIEYKNASVVTKDLERFVRSYLYKNNSDSGVIHGDFCLSNILCDPNNLIFKFIDPRGSFGIDGIFGDQKYDLAKLRHSFHGLYDFIIADLFILEETSNGFMFNTLHKDNHIAVANLYDSMLEMYGYSLKEIGLIESLLFLSMIPLHADTPERQKAMYLTAIKTLNEFQNL